MALTPEEKKERARWSHIKRTYGITKEQYDAIDPGKCVVCDRSWSAAVRPCVDHDHTTGEIRGLLCIHCNRYVVGRHRNSELLKRASDYLAGPFTGLKVPPKPKRKRKKRK